MPVRDGIIERKEAGVACAPPWGTDYENKSRRTTQSLMSIPASNKCGTQDKIRNGIVCSDGEAPSHHHPLTDDNGNIIEKAAGGDSEVDGRPLHQLDDQVKLHGVTVTEDDNDKIDAVRVVDESETKSTLGDDSPDDVDMKEASRAKCVSESLMPNNRTVGLDRLFPKSSDESTRYKGSKYETSNSAYGLHRQDNADYSRTHRRDSTFSKLYGDTQPWKK